MIGKVLFVTKDYSGDVDIKLLCLDTNLASRRIISNRNMKRVLNFLSDILKFAHLCDLIHVYDDNCSIQVDIITEYRY